MRSVTYLVTGGAGFIGSHLARALVERGDQVRILDDFSTGRALNLRDLEGRVDVVRGDIRDLETVREAVRDVEVVFHQAALASVPRSIQEPVKTLEINVLGTQHVLLAAHEARIRRVVFASSSSVYGNTPTLPKREDMPLRPLSPYAVQKVTGELLCRMYTDTFGLQTVALRYFNIFGPGQDPGSTYAAVIPRFLHTLVSGGCPIVFGDGEQSRDFTFIANAVQANLLAADAPDAVGQAVNVGCGQRVTLNEMLHVAGSLLGVQVKAEYRAPRAGDVHDSLADVSLAERLLGYRPAVTFAAGLAQTVDALRQQDSVLQRDLIARNESGG